MLLMLFHPSVHNNKSLVLCYLSELEMCVRIRFFRKILTVQCSHLIDS